MGIVLLKFDTSDGEKNLVRNLAQQGVVYFRMNASPCVCFVSHDLRNHFWNTMLTPNYNETTISSVYDSRNLKQFPAEPSSQFKIIKIMPNLSALIKLPILASIQMHERYCMNATKYMLLSQLHLCDVVALIMKIIFWLEIKRAFETPSVISNPLLISDQNMERVNQNMTRAWKTPSMISYYDDEDSAKIFKDITENYPHDWML